MSSEVMDWAQFGVQLLIICGSIAGLYLGVKTKLEVVVQQLNDFRKAFDRQVENCEDHFDSHSNRIASNQETTIQMRERLRALEVKVNGGKPPVQKETML